MRQPEGTTLWGEVQRRILDGVFLRASESQNVLKNVEKERNLKNACG